MLLLATGDGTTAGDENPGTSPAQEHLEGKEHQCPEVQGQADEAPQK
jgi:hypothetical protein